MYSKKNESLDARRAPFLIARYHHLIDNIKLKNILPSVKS